MAPSLVSARMKRVESELATTWLGYPTTILDQVDSTNSWLKERWQSGVERNGAAVWADTQTNGRGRLGRSWESPPGSNIYTSVLLEPPKDRLAGVLSLAAGVAVAQAVRRLTGLDARIKWPNDAVIAGRKFCGILVQAGTEPTPWAIVGIGINVTGKVGESFPHAISLEAAGAGSVVREDLWLALIRELEMAYDTWLARGDGWAVHAWEAVNATLGQEVRVERPGQVPWIGWAERIDPDGGLWVVGPRGRVKVVAGEVSLRLADGRYAPDSF